MSNRLTHQLLAVLGALPPQALSLVESAPSLRLKTGEPLLRDGDRWQHLWWVSSGALRLYYLDRNGQASNKNFFLEGAMFWPITPDLAQLPVSFWVEALEPTEVWALPWLPWQAATSAFDPWQRLERRVLAALLQDKMRREQQFLQDTATERYQALVAAHPEWMQRIALHHLASYLGITDVALSRIRKRLK